MVTADPDSLVTRLHEAAPPDQTHTVVIWTKNPKHLFTHPGLNACIQEYDQRFLLYSITGLGGSALEPGVPKPEQAMAYLPDLVNLFQGPERVRVRFDPIVHFMMPDEKKLCNLDFFSTLAPVLAENGIQHVITSWVEIYPKVKARLARHGITAIEPTPAQKETETRYLQETAGQYGLNIHGCCMPGWPVNRCIDGHLLNLLHPKGLKTSTRKAPGQRPLCGCTFSKDIGWYFSCPNGCLYCYGNPAKT